VVGTDAAFLDIFDPAFHLRSPQALAARERHWFAGTPLGVAVLRHADVSALLRDRRLVQQGRHLLAAQGVTEGLVVEWLARSMIAVEGETHHRLRTAVSRAFTPRHIEELRSLMGDVCRELVSGFAGGGQVEFVEQFAGRYSIRIMCRLFGIPDADADTLAAWVERVGLVFALPVTPHLPAITEGLTALYAYVDELIASRLAAPGTDLVSALLALEAEGGRIDRDEVRAQVVGLIFAGHDTTRCQLSLAMTVLLEHPDQWAALASRPELAPGAVEEVMRVAPAVPATGRYAPEDVEYRDLHMVSGTAVLLCTALAHTDPEVYGPDAAFDITAERPPSLGFGGGPHYCLGAVMARMEMSEALPVLARGMPDARVTDIPSWRPALGITGPNQLFLEFTSAC